MWVLKKKKAHTFNFWAWNKQSNRSIKKKLVATSNKMLKTFFFWLQIMGQVNH